VYRPVRPEVPAGPGLVAQVIARIIARIAHDIAAVRLRPDMTRSGPAAPIGGFPARSPVGGGATRTAVRTGATVPAVSAPSGFAARAAIGLRVAISPLAAFEALGFGRCGVQRGRNEKQGCHGGAEQAEFAWCHRTRLRGLRRFGSGQIAPRLGDGR
jgi:hypothetical protein